MSAKNRGLKPIENEFYCTPDWLIDPILDAILPKSPISTPYKILEPACGAGAIVKRILAKNFGYTVDVDCCDIELRGYGSQQDFLTMPVEKKYDLIITNPPFSLAWEFVQKALEFRRFTDSKVALLLRVNWLGSKKRAKWIRDNVPSIYVTPRRPKFRLNKKGKLGTDATEYAWFVWGEHPPTIHILPTEDTE